MRIPVVGMDPSLRHWGLVRATLDLYEGYLSDVVPTLVEPKDLKGKQVRVNSNDLHLCEQLAATVFKIAKECTVIFVECPVGSQNARSMASYGFCVGILGSMRAAGLPLIEVAASDVKMALTGNPQASKNLMVKEAKKLYPEVHFPQYKESEARKAEHIADAIGAIHAGVNTQTFQNLRLMLMNAKG